MWQPRSGKFDNPDMLLDIEKECNSASAEVYISVPEQGFEVETVTVINLFFQRFLRKLKDKEYHYHNFLHSRGLEKLGVDYIKKVLVYANLD